MFANLQFFSLSFVLIKRETLIQPFLLTKHLSPFVFSFFFALTEPFSTRFFNAGYVFFLVPFARTRGRSTWVSPPSNTLTTRRRRFRCMPEREVKETPRANRFPSFTKAPTAEGRRRVASTPTTQSETDNGPRSHRPFKHLNREESVESSTSESQIHREYVKIAKSCYINSNYPKIYPIPYLLQISSLCIYLLFRVAV